MNLKKEFEKLGFELLDYKFMPDKYNELYFKVKFKILNDASDFTFSDNFKTVIPNLKVALDMFKIRNDAQRMKRKKECSL